MASNITDNTAQRIRHSAVLPATCSPGDVYVDDAGGSTGMYVCLATNTWSGPFSTGNGIGGSGTVNTLAKFTPDGTTVGNSQITDDGSEITVNAAGSIFLNSASQQITMDSGTSTLTVDGANDEIDITAAAAINLDSASGIFKAGNIASDQWVISATSGGVGLNNNDAGVGVTVDSSGVYPTVSATGAAGTVTNPFRGIIVGNATGNSSQITGVFTTNRVATLPDATGTIALIGVNTPNLTNSISLTAQSASIGATNIQVNGGVAPAGLYRLSYYLVITTAGTSGTVSATFGWSDPAAARTSGTGNVTFGTLAAPATGSVIIRANGVANITYLTTVTAAVGSPAYALYISLERLQ